MENIQLSEFDLPLRLLELGDKAARTYGALFPPEPTDVERYRATVTKLLSEVHESSEWRQIIDLGDSPDLSLRFDCCHVQYTSPVLYLLDPTRENPWVRNYMRPRPYGVNANENKSLFEKIQYFNNKVETYGVRHILPGLEADLCSLTFLPARDLSGDNSAAEKFMDGGVFPIDKSGIETLTQILMSRLDRNDQGLVPWDISDTEITEYYHGLAKDERWSRGNQFSRMLAMWNEARNNHCSANGAAWGKRLPESKELFQYALQTALNTLQIVSKPLFEANLRTRIPHGHGRVTIDDARKARKELLAELSTDGSEPQRSLVLIRIPVIPLAGLDKRKELHENASTNSSTKRGKSARRFAEPDGGTDSSVNKIDQTMMETIASLAFYSTEPVTVQHMLRLNVAERFLFMALREREVLIARDAIAQNYAQQIRSSLFAKRLAHNIKTPFGNVRQLLDQTEKSILDVESRLSQFAEGKFDRLIRRFPVPVQRELQKAEKAVAPTIDARKLQYENRISADTKVYADATDVRDMIEILMDNATKYATSYLTIYTRDEIQKDDAVVQIIFENDGPVMSAEKQRRLFTAPVHIDAENVERGKGFGIGLFLARWSARDNRGDLTYECVEPGIHRFILSLPSPPPNA